MSTTVHLPSELVARLDQRARSLGVSRNRYIRQALELAVDRDDTWSPHFLAMLREAGKDVEAGREIDDLRRAVAARRTGKGPPHL